jgi:hypothetical protein
MYAVRLPLLAGAIALAGLAVGSAATTQMGAGLSGMSSLEVSSGLSVQNWTLHEGEVGTQHIETVSVSGVPQSVVGQQMTVYLNGSTTGTAVGTITSAGVTQIPVAGTVRADQISNVSIVIAG